MVLFAPSLAFTEGLQCVPGFEGTGIAKHIPIFQCKLRLDLGAIGAWEERTLRRETGRNHKSPIENAASSIVLRGGA